MEKQRMAPHVKKKKKGVFYFTASAGCLPQIIPIGPDPT